MLHEPQTVLLRYKTNSLQLCYASRMLHNLTEGITNIEKKPMIAAVEYLAVAAIPLENGSSEQTTLQQCCADQVCLLHQRQPTR